MNTKKSECRNSPAPALTLVSAGIMPLASATENEGAGSDLDRYSPPQLNVDPSIETTAIPRR